MNVNISSLLDGGENATPESPVIPSSPADRLKLKTMVSEGTYCLQRIKDERDALSDLIDAIHDKYKTPKKIIRKLINTRFKNNFADQTAELEDFEFAYEALFAVATRDDADADEPADE